MGEHTEETLRVMLSTHCKFCGKGKLSGCLFCDPCWQKLPGFMATRINHAILNLSNAYREATEELEK
jgi:hypothetical protein